MKVLVTGASGFIGRALAPALRASGYEVVTPGRAEIGDIGPNTDWRRALEGAEAVIHLAGVAHIRADKGAYQRINTEGSRVLAEQAAQSGAARFIFVSSVKAAADHSDAGPLMETDAPTPGSAYGRSKLEAERAVLALSALRPVALRPPLVHAPDAKANFALLMRLAATNAPLPFGSIDNRRSLISRSSLIGAIVAVLQSPTGPSGAFFVADRPALSTGDIIASLRSGWGRPAGLFPARALAGLAPVALRENLEVDDTRFRDAYGFAGAESAAALAATARTWKTRPR